MWRSRWRCVIKPAYSVSFLLSINIFVWQNVLYFLDAPRICNYILLSLYVGLGAKPPGKQRKSANNWQSFQNKILGIFFHWFLFLGAAFFYPTISLNIMRYDSKTCLSFPTLLMLLSIAETERCIFVLWGNRHEFAKPRTTNTLQAGDEFTKYLLLSYRLQKTDFGRAQREDFNK